jgi:hypothetical protein
MKERSMQELMQLLENISDNKLPTIDQEMDSYFGSKPGVLEEGETATLEEVMEMQMNMGSFIKNLKENMDDNFDSMRDLMIEQAEFMQEFDGRIKNLEELLSSDRTIN